MSFTDYFLLQPGSSNIDNVIHSFMELFTEYPFVTSPELDQEMEI